MSANVERFAVHRREPMRCEVQSAALAAPGASEIVLAVDKFGLTSNNVTYAALGDALHYFEFFPVSEEWSALPVWGMATVAESKVASVPAGARVFGYYPAATHVTLSVAGTTPMGFQAKRNLPPEFAFYDQYTVTSRDPLYLRDQEDMMVVMRPLFLTGVLLADYLEVSEFMRAGTVVVSSAASKTSFGMGCALKQGVGPKLIGLCSQASRGSAVRLGIYDAVFTYDELEALPEESVVYVDVAGSAAVRDELARRLGSALKLVLSVGLTHWQEGAFGGSSGSAVKTEMFFAPGWVERRRVEAGAAFFAKMGASWQAQMAQVDRHFKLVHRRGAAALQESFEALVAGRAAPDEAWLCSL